MDVTFARCSVKARGSRIPGKNRRFYLVRNIPTAAWPPQCGQGSALAAGVPQPAFVQGLERARIWSAVAGTVRECTAPGVRDGAKRHDRRGERRPASAAGARILGASVLTWGGRVLTRGGRVLTRGG